MTPDRPRHQHVSILLLCCCTLSLLLAPGCSSHNPAAPDTPVSETTTSPAAPTPKSGEELYQLGMQYANPKEGEPDLARAYALFEQSYATGNLRAAHALGWLYFSGKAVEKDYRKAFLFFKDAAEHGNLPDAQHMLSVLYGNGWGVTKDTKQSWYWTKRAAANGQPEAIAILRAMREKSVPMKK